MAKATHSIQAYAVGPNGQLVPVPLSFALIDLIANVGQMAPSKAQCYWAADVAKNDLSHPFDYDYSLSPVGPYINPAGAAVPGTICIDFDGMADPATIDALTANGWPSGCGYKLVFMLL